MPLENQKYSARKLIFPQMKKVSENYLQFGLAPSKMFASFAIYIYLCVCVIWCRTILSSVCYPHIKLKKMCRTVHRTWTPTLKEEQRMRVYENRVLRRIFGPNRNEVTGSRAT
jgi:hypothetical protein